MFETGGLEVIRATDGSAGLALARAHRPDLIVSDVHMPGLNGFEVLKRIRQDPQTAHIPCMVVTVDARDAVRRTCLALGADVFLEKPFTFDQLIGTARSLLADTETDCIP
jgi:CheY-like chemotaxis protein